MNSLLALFVVTAVIAVDATPIGGGSAGLYKDAIVEIEKQRLIKFPEDQIEQRYPLPPQTTHNQSQANAPNSEDEAAKRILAQIEKVNEAFGYVRKQTAQSKVPPILDSSQYLFPKPSYHPYHENNHQFAGTHGETLLVPSIRAFQERYAPQYPTVMKYSSAKAINYNVPPRNSVRQDEFYSPHTRAQTADGGPLRPIKDFDEGVPQQGMPQITMNSPRPMEYYFRPNEVHVPAPQSDDDREQLPAHFAIPVRLFHLNKDEYVEKYAPQEYRVKGYKIVGDVDNFYGKAKHKLNSNVHGKTKSTPKYHLFFLPRELVLNEDSTFKHPKGMSAAASKDTPSENASREEKVASRPLKIQGPLTTAQNKNGQNSTATGIQGIRKRIIPKPLREKDTVVASQTPLQPVGNNAVNVISTNTIKITPPALSLHTQNDINVPAQILQATNEADSGNKLTSALGFFTNRPVSGTLNNPTVQATLTGSETNGMKTNNRTAANVIKDAFQNIFRLPFRPDRPNQLAPGATASNLESVPLQVPQKTFFGTFRPQFTTGQVQQQQPQSLYVPQRPANEAQGDADDYDDGSNSNSAAEDEGASVEEQVEKQIFGNRNKQQQDTQREAIKQGGIIIQRLKVRKGGIAIAGPGGVATAGSGGTAIVGPGGYALTHPRSLTIAGPGAKIIAIPSNVDLRDALERTNIGENTFPREGRIVATGPAIYYSPTTTGTAPDAAEE